MIVVNVVGIQRHLKQCRCLARRRASILTDVDALFCSSASDGSSKGGGYLSTEDSQGSAETIFLEEGFLDFLNKVHTD